MKRMDELLEMKTEYQAITPPPELEGRVREAMERARAAKARMASLSQLKAEYLSREVPVVLESRVKTSIKRASVKRHRNQTFRVVRNVSVAAAAAVTVFILPNSNAEVASAMSSIPVIGGFVQAITVRDYSRETAHSELSAKVPEVEIGKDEKKPEGQTKPGEQEKPSTRVDSPSAELPILPAGGEDAPFVEEAGEATSGAAAEITDSVQAYIQTLLEAFRRDEATGGYVALSTDYRVVTDTDDWFTLEISASYTRADCVERLRYYHIDKHTGRVANLGDAFYDDAQWRAVINSAIEKQIDERIKAGEDFFTRKEAKIYGDSFAFESISDDANFYFDEDGNIVIVIDSGEIAPESTGTVFFTVKTSSMKDMLRYDLGRERQTSSGHETTEEETTTEETTGGAQDIFVPVEHHDGEVDDRRPEGSSGTSTEIVIEDEDIEQAIEEEVDDMNLQGNSGTEASEEVTEDAESAASADTSDSDTINETQIEEGGDEEPSIEPQTEIETENESETTGEVAED